MVTVAKPKRAPTSTVGRAKSFNLKGVFEFRNPWKSDSAVLACGDSLDNYQHWEEPTVIVSDGAYGILGFEGDTFGHSGLPDWYEPHIKAWSEKASAQTTLWFWNSEIGWASVHPVLEKHGWRYVNCNTWNKGKGHIAGNVNTSKIRRFPVVSEVCVQYVFEARIGGIPCKDWLRKEWQRTGLPMRLANQACGVKGAAVRKYLDAGHLWYPPPPEMFEGMARFANSHGAESGKPYFSSDGKKPMSGKEWSRMRAKFSCPMGFTNVWERGALRGAERVKAPLLNSKAAHLNQKPLDLMNLIIEASSESGDVVWEPFGGLFSASLAASRLKRKAFACEIDPDYYCLGINRFRNNELF